LDVVEADTPREVAAESTVGFTWDVLEQAESQRAIGARKSRVVRCMVFGLSSGAEGLPEQGDDGNRLRMEGSGKNPEPIFKKV
jgi:hypothetical protein